MDARSKEQLGYFTGKRPEMLQFIPKEAKKVLEIGCSDGSFGTTVKNEKQAEVWGIELDEKAGAVAKTRLDKVFIGNLEDNFTSLPEKYFDCIIFNDVLEHLMDPWAVLKTMKRFLTENGQLIASIPNFCFWANLVQIVMKGDWQYESSGILDYTHIRFFTKKSINRMFLEAGFDNISIHGINPDNNIKFKLLNLLMLGTIKDFQYPQFACSARKKN